jgi:tetratricopeptide (TPR) repeat protein
LEREEAARKLQDPSTLHLKYAQWRENAGDLVEARQSYQDALKQNPKSLEAKLGLARLDQLAGRTAEAEKGFQSALNSRSGDPQAKNALGQFYALQKEWSKAIPLLEDAADAAPHEPSYRYHLAVAMAQSGDIDGAFPQFQQVVGEAEAHYNIGYLLHEKGHPELARPRFQKALAVNPKLIQAQVMLDQMQAKSPDTLLAKSPTPRLAAVPSPIQQTSATLFPPVRSIDHATYHQEPAAWPAMKSAGQQTHPAAPAYSHAAQPETFPPTKPAFSHVPGLAEALASAPEAVHNPPAFRSTEPAAITPALVHNPPAFRPTTTTVATAPEPVHNPPAFRPTQTQNWNQTETTGQAPEFLPPYQPQADSKPSPTGNAVATPPITAAQKEQWENQMKAQGNP